jgi:hypothetical protein
MNFNKIMQRFSPYPDQALCFWLGFLTTGLWLALLASAVDGVFLALAGSDDSSDGVFFQTLFLYGIPAGLFARMLGYWFRDYRSTSPFRWIWLCLPRRSIDCWAVSYRCHRFY